MARIRSIKPEFFQNDRLAELSPLHWILFVGLWTQADREGRLEDRPKRIKIALLPYDDCDVDAMLDDLTQAGFLTRYEHGAGPVLARCIAIPGFLRHQQPHIKEPPSNLPPPQEEYGSPVQARCKPGAGTGPGRVRPVGGEDQEGRGGEPAGAGPALGSDRTSPAPTAEDLRALWNLEADALMPRCAEVPRLSADQRRAISLRALDGPTGHRAVIERMSASPFCRGETPKSRGPVDFVFMLKHAADVLNGRYDDHHTPKPSENAGPAYKPFEDA